MNRVEVRALIQEKNEWCISIIIPTSRTSPDRRVDAEVLEKAISHTKVLLSNKKPPPKAYDTLVHSIDTLALQVDPVHAMDGLGLFISPDMAKLVHFPFPVTEKIIVDKSFETRDLYFLEQFAKPYYVLKLSKSEAHLYLLETGTEAREITNTYFPIRNNNNNYEYAKPTLGTSFGFARKGFEKDKNIINKTRQEPFFNEVQQNLVTYIKTSDLLVSGARNIVSNFESTRDKRLKIKGRIIGSYHDLNELFSRARSTYYECKYHEIQAIVDSLEELSGRKKVASGIHDVWAATVAGKGDLLLVEKDYRKIGYLLQNGQQMNLHVPLSEHEIIPDLVDQIIEIVIDKGGRIIFTEENQLEKYERIALILRY